MTASIAMEGNMSRKEKYYESSGNVFADLGFKNPERLLARAQLMLRITEIIKARCLTQKDASRILGVPQSKVSCLMNGKLSMFSMDLLLQFLNALGRDVDIVIKPMSRHEKTAGTHVLISA